MGNYNTFIYNIYDKNFEYLTFTNEYVEDSCRVIPGILPYVIMGPLLPVSLILIWAFYIVKRLIWVAF